MNGLREEKDDTRTGVGGTATTGRTKVARAMMVQSNERRMYEAVTEKARRDGTWLRRALFIGWLKFKLKSID